uniref:Uncharacterized protein n=1 Tax=Fagus sylvatica TaxID=28930 RepID=A0A2N9FGY6_FAGSY
MRSFLKGHRLWRYVTDATILATKRDQFCLIQFLMALTSEFEPIRVALLQQIVHIFYNYPTKPPKAGQSRILSRLVNHSVVAAAEESLSDPSLSSVSVSELGSLVFIMVKQFLSTSDKVCSAVSSNTWILGRIRFLGQAVKWDGCSSSLHSIYLPCRHTLRLYVAHTASVFPLSCWHLRLGTSQQNGRVKCKHRHILDSVRAFLIFALCPKRFFGEATLTVVYIINRLPSSALQNVAPFEHLYDPSAILPIPPTDSLVSPPAPPLVVDPILDQTSNLPLAAPLASPTIVDFVLDQPSDLPLADSLVSPQEPAPPVDLVTNQTPPLPFR